ncbi:hypothetical protein N8775_02060 [Candidatus Pelagibacter ubique]|nr:hypothetical protein [Candidatus Pelagibacter ubique]
MSKNIYAKKLCKALEQDLKESNEKFETVKYFRQNMVSVAIWLACINSYYNKKDLSVEDIYRKVNQIVRTSRPSVVRYLEEAKNSEYLEFHKNSNDKRSYKIIPREKTIYEFEQWSDVFNV